MKAPKEATNGLNDVMFYWHHFLMTSLKKMNCFNDVKKHSELLAANDFFYLISTF